VYQPLFTDNKVTVTITATKHGQISVIPAETYEQDAQTCQEALKNAENELKEAKKTISHLETENENLKPEEEKTPIPEETAEVKPIRKVRRVKT